MATSQYRVTGMTCGHCEASVREEVGQIIGVEVVEVVEVCAASGVLAVTCENTIDDAVVVAAVEDAGYRAVPVR